jgi:hypothetical protein
MSREAAKIIIALVLRHSAEQNQALFDIEQACSPEEFRQYKQMIGASMGSMLLDVINPIVAKYPELRPPQLEEW